MPVHSSSPPKFLAHFLSGQEMVAAATISRADNAFSALFTSIRKFVDGRLILEAGVIG